MDTARKNAWLGLGTLLAAMGASLCCILPVTVAFLGLGSAALGAELEPFRPYFLLLTVGFLGSAFYREYRPRGACAPGEACAVAENRRRRRIILWVIAAMVVLLVTFPYYANWLF